MADLYAVRRPDKVEGVLHMTQTALPLEIKPALPLREAYERTHTIKSRMTYEQAMSRPVLAMVLRLYAEAIAKKRNQA